MCVTKKMPFPRDVQGVYGTTEREVVNPESGKTVKRTLAAWVRIGEVLLKAGTNPPASDIEVELETAGSVPNRQRGERASVKIGASKNFGLSSVGRPDYLNFEPTRSMVEMENGMEQLQFTFSVVLPPFAKDEPTPWKFKKTGKIGTGADWFTPSPQKPVERPIKDPVSPIRKLDLSDSDSDSDSKSDNSHLIMIAVVMLLAAAAAANM